MTRRVKVGIILHPWKPILGKGDIGTEKVPVLQKRFTISAVNC